MSLSISLSHTHKHKPTHTHTHKHKPTLYLEYEGEGRDISSNERSELLLNFEIKKDKKDLQMQLIMSGVKDKS